MLQNQMNKSFIGKLRKNLNIYKGDALAIQQKLTQIKIMRIRVAGIIPMEEGFALMHRTGNKVNGILDYHVFPGGGLEENESLEEGVVREVKEEFGIDVEVIEKKYELENGEVNKKEYFYLCKYISGEFGTGNGPEFNNDPKYADRGKYTPEIIKREEIEKINLLPDQIKEKFVEDVKNGRI